MRDANQSIAASTHAICCGEASYRPHRRAQRGGGEWEGGLARARDGVGGGRKRAPPPATSLSRPRAADPSGGATCGTGGCQCTSTAALLRRTARVTAPAPAPCSAPLARRLGG